MAIKIIIKNYTIISIFNVFFFHRWQRSFSDRRGRTCVVCHSGAGRLGTLKYNSFRWRSIRMFNRLPKSIRMLSSCSVVGFKSKLDSYLRNIVDLPCRPGFNNSLDGGDCLHGGHYADDLAAN